MTLRSCAVCVVVCAWVVTFGFQVSRQAVHAAPSLVFGTSFDCPEWNQVNGDDPCAPNDGIDRYGNWLTASGRGDEITAAANNPLGSGRGFRHWRGAGTNSNGGSLFISFAPSSQVWLRFYMRYSPGFAFEGGQPHYTKEIYWHVQDGGNAIFGFSDGLLYTFTPVVNFGSNNIKSSDSWAAINGGSVGDGRFHHYEQYINASTGQLRIWRDGQLVLDRSGVNYGRSQFGQFALGENQNVVAGGDHYTDYDDIAVSTTGYIGPIGQNSSGPAAPSNVRIIG